MNSPLAFQAFAHTIVNTLEDLRLGHVTRIEDLIPLDRGQNNPDSRISTLLDNLPGYRSGDLEMAQQQLSTARTVVAADREWDRQKALEPKFIETYIDAKSGEFCYGRDPRPKMVITQETVTVYRFQKRT